MSQDSQANTYWERNPNAAYASSQWTSNRIIHEVVNNRMSGKPSGKHWLNWLLENYFAGKSFQSLLSPGCGVGDHELIIARSGLFSTIDAFDFSQASVELARNKAAEADVAINFYADDLNGFSIPKDRTYDVVICSGSLHHVRELERFLGIIREVLKPDGYFVINEYVGDCYNVYNQHQVGLINRIYACFPKSLRGSLARFENHTIEQSIATDPSESVRSKLILPFLENYFHMEVCNPFGGSLLHPLYPLLNHEALEGDDPKSEAIIRLLLEIESILLEIPGGLDSDFCLCIMRQKGWQA